jgi:hypothetical protein
MIQEQMQFDGSFGPPKVSPIKHRQTQINDGRIHPDQFILKPKLLLPDLDLNPASVEEFQEDMLVEVPGTMFVGISQRGMTGSTDAQMFEFAFATSEPSGNLSERMSPSQLTEEHGHKLAPTGESFGITFCLGHFNQMLKLQTRKQL